MFRAVLFYLGFWLFFPAALAQKLTVLTHNSFSISEQIINDFTEQTGIKVLFLEGGDAADTINRAILTKKRPLADVLYGVDNNLINRAISENIFQPYKSSQLEHIPQAYQADFKGFATPVDIGFVNFNLDDEWFLANKVEPPSDISQLTTETYKGLTVVENPLSSTPGLAFMLTTIAKFGDDWLYYWADLRDNDLLVSEGWTEAYYTAFTRYGGDRPIVLSYASSPAAEVFFADKELEKSPTSNLFCEVCVYRQIEAVGILTGTKQTTAAKAFVDYMLTINFQEDIPLNMFVYPVHQAAKLPEEFTHSQIPQESELAQIPANVVTENLTKWQDNWTQIVLQGQEP